MTNRIERLATLANKMMLTASQSVALPTAVTLAASKVGYSEEAMIDAIMVRPALSEYIANVCRGVTA